MKSHPGSEVTPRDSHPGGWAVGGDDAGGGLGQKPGLVPALGSGFTAAPSPPYCLPGFCSAGVRSLSLHCYHGGSLPPGESLRARGQKASPEQ